MTDRADRQRELLRAEPLAWLWRRARHTLQLRPEGWSDATVRLADPTPAQREALDGLLGRRTTGGLTVRLADLDATLRSGPLACSLADWLTELHGPLRDRPAEQATTRAQLAHAHACADASPHAAAPWFVAWRAQLTANGQLTQLLPRLHQWEQALAVLTELPARVRVRAALAAAHTGDPKALDKGTVATLVLGALAHRYGVEPPTDAESIRALWEQAGVVTDTLASQVIALNLRPTGEDPLSSWLRAAADRGHPIVLTLADLQAHALTLPATPTSICENPAIIHAAAERFGSACPPLLCTSGRPHAAFWRLGEALRRAGAPLRYHGDLDPPGLQIARDVITRLEARPWRMAAVDYLEAVTALGSARRCEVPERLDTPWDSGLAEAMRARGVVVYEEQVLDGLLKDLGDATP